ncbi:50S ribosomal protein L25/general stress protein Ctc [Streptomyces sp. NPDC001812]|uniref:Large ribosomal subunit protein bL25 n=1 Tax=Streptomyces cathayae TaxID=3031124 RepID=A0ABY8K7M9_9ACTN|nr:50S ribosomal protein L25/general stress protein Ctc [Streptomyces sp. HUAS 5]WGD42478.1 50S ribosomal protein L25/general stress protein Ctc [Streptomyces sp. HUAS 5]
MADVKLHAETRTEFGKGAARRVRRDNKVPGVVYEHGLEPLHLTFPGHELLMALRTSNVLIDLVIDGEGSQLAIPKAVQRDPLRGDLVHVDLLMVKRGERVTVEIPVHAEGELAPGGNLLEHVLSALPVEAEATNIPDSLTASVQGLAAGDAVLAKDLVLPEGVKLAVEEDTVVLQVLAAQAEEVSEGEEAAEA